ncbi:MAG: secretin N-terminal domain-containing protein [Phycisphaerae bacterium]
MEYFNKVGFGTVSRIPNTNSILITAQPAVLTKARFLAELIDSNTPCEVEVLPVFEELSGLALKDLISQKIPHTDFGTFAEMPDKGNRPRAIIDVGEKSMILVAEPQTLTEILRVIEDLLAENAEGHFMPPSEPNSVIAVEEIEAISEDDNDLTGALESSEINDINNDEFFNGLMKSLAEAERAAEELKLTSDQRTVAAEETQPKPEMTVSKQVKLETEQLRPEIRRLAYAPERVELADETLELDLPETLNIVDLIDLAGKYLNLHLLYDPAEVRGTVTLRVQRKITVGELYPLLESVLKFRGFVTSRKNNLVTIVPISRVDEIDPLLIDGQERIPQYGDTIVTRVFELRYIDAQSAENLLNQMKLGANILSIPAARKLFVTGYAFRMPRVEEMLSIIDQPGRLKHFRYRQLRFTMARNLSTQIQALAEQLGTVSVTVAAPTTAAPFEAGPVQRGRPTRITAQQQQQMQQQAAQAEGTEGPSVYLDADERTNRILMIGLEEDLNIIERLIDSLDVVQQDLRTFKLYEILYVGAEEIRDKLIELNIIGSVKTTPQETSRRITQQRQQQMQPMPEQQQMQATVEFTEEGLVEKPSVVLVEATNSLLVNATAEQHAQIATIIAFVDTQPQEAATNYVVYPLENQDPQELVNVLNDLIRETVTEFQEADSKLITTVQKRKDDEDITIVADSRTYSLIVYANRKNQAWVKSLIDQLDEYRPQVLLDCTLVEISKNDKFNYDLNLISSFPDLLNTSGLANVLVAGDPPLTSDNIISQLQSSGRSRFIDLQSKSGAGRGFYGDKHINLLLDAVQQKNYGRVLARPKLLVNDNQEGTITATETTYRTRTETSFLPTDGNPIQTENIIFEPFEAEITLRIKPHISKGDQLRLNIELIRSDFRDTAASLRATNPTPPDKLRRQVNSNVTVPDGATIILGGLENINQSKGGSKVPLLGDVPLVGGLFRNIANTDDQSRLYIFVKAHILRPGEALTGQSDIEIVSRKNRETFEKYEDEMQKYEDWPGLKAKPMDPLRVLEDD